MSMPTRSIINTLLIFAVLVVWLILLIFKIENMLINILLAVVLTTNIIFLHLAAIKRCIEGELVIHRNKAPISWFFILFAVLFLINPLTRFFGMALIFTGIVIYLLYLFKRPMGIVVENQNLIFNNLYLEFRNINEIRRI
jgi:hypothetical protein